MAERILKHKTPEYTLFHPNWWHARGLKMRFIPEESNLIDKVVIRGSAAELKITYAGTIRRHIDLSIPEQHEWNIDWTVRQCNPTQEKTNGRVRFDKETILAAFGSDLSTPEWSAWLIDRFGGTCAEQGKFIRYQNFLNIPCPGTGSDGDPNISIDLDDEIRGAVLSLLDSARVNLILSL